MDTRCPFPKQAAANTTKAKYRFVIIGSGWRAQYYVRISKALPHVFELCAMYCRTAEKAEQIAAEYSIHTSTSIEECVSCQPDFVVVAVSKTSIAEVSLEWLQRGFTVLCETPVAVDLDTLKRIRAHIDTNLTAKLVVAEQYQFYPVYSALIKLVQKGLIGTPDCLNISLAHEYHAASLMRALLGVSVDTPFSVTAKTYSFPTVETLTRYASFTDGHISDKKRTVATFEFDGGKVAFYDFDSEQYRSPIRKNFVKIQGCRGEIINDHVYYLDSENKPKQSDLIIKSRLLETKNSNPNFHFVEEITQITFEDEILYTPIFGLCGLSQDETAIAHLMRQTAEYARDNAPSPYPLREAMQDAYMGIMLCQAAKLT